MTGAQFDPVTQAGAGRVSRRTALRGGAIGIAAGALTGSGLRTAAQQATPVATPEGMSVTPDMLPSWTDGPARQRILSFLNSVLDPASDAFVEPADRVATFDLDGTLWSEQPVVLIDFLLGHIYQLAESHPELRTIQPYRAVWEQDSGYFDALIEADLAGDTEALDTFWQALMGPLAGMTPAEYDATVQAFFDQSMHPDLNVPYRQTIYQPMAELIGVLQANAFDVYIVTGSERDFVRGVSEQLYGIARSNVIGSGVNLAYEVDERGSVLVRLTTLDGPFDNGPGKPIQIERQVGRQPILVGGNSDGDVAMIAYAQEQHADFLGLLVNHDDADREFAYTEGAETALEIAGIQGWTVISMRDDFAQVFPS
jgi:phosphoserine phosphatase